MSNSATSTSSQSAAVVQTLVAEAQRYKFAIGVNDAGGQQWQQKQTTYILN
jgi:hypothetical protein